VAVGMRLEDDAVHLDRLLRRRRRGVLVRTAGDDDERSEDEALHEAVTRAITWRRRGPSNSTK